MNDRVSIDPAAAAAIVERAPARLVKKLDVSPGIADTFVWERDRASTTVLAGAERVTLQHTDGVVKASDDVACTCLLSPKCFHVLAVVSALPIAEASAPVAPRDPSPSSEGHKMVLSASDRKIAHRMIDALGNALSTGLSAIGTLDRAEILRAVHAARVAGLHRLASRALGFLEAGRALGQRGDTFDLDETTLVLADALTTAIRLERGEADKDLVGIARRSYESIGSLRVFGLACEPVVTKAGYAGIVTYVASGKGVIYTIEDVMPGDVGRAIACYEAGIRLGEASLSHGALSRKGLFVENATASLDARLGAGAAVSAVTAVGADFQSEPVSALFSVSLSDQVSRALDARSSGLRPRGSELLFLEGEILGTDARGVLFAADANERERADGDAQAHLPREPRVRAALRLVARLADRRLPTTENLRVLGLAVGARVRVIGRMIPTESGTIELLTIAPVGPGLTLSEESAGKVHVGFDRLARSQVSRIDDRSGAHRAADEASIASLSFPQARANSDPLAALERRAARMVLGGRRSLTSRASSEIAREGAVLEKSLSPTARRALEGLLAASSKPVSTTQSDHGSFARELAEAWLRVVTVIHVTRKTFAHAAWRNCLLPNPRASLDK